MKKKLGGKMCRKKKWTKKWVGKKIFGGILFRHSKNLTGYIIIVGRKI